MVEKDENEMKSTTDFYLACYLEIKLKKLCEIKKQPNSTNVLFLFNKKEYNDNVEGYYNNAEVRVIELKDKIKNLKSRIINI